MAAVLTALAGALVGAVAGLLPSAAAHNELLAAIPADGARMAVPPRQIRFTFNADVAPEFATVTATIDDGAPQRLSSRVTGPQVEASIPDATRTRGTWTVAYRVVGADGHPITGTVRFTVRPAGSTATTPNPSTPNQSGSTATPSLASLPTTLPTPPPTPIRSAASPTVEPTASPAAVPRAADERAPSGLGWWVIPVFVAVTTLMAAPIAAAMLGASGDRVDPDSVGGPHEQTSAEHAFAEDSLGESEEDNPAQPETPAGPPPEVVEQGAPEPRDPGSRSPEEGPDERR